MRIRLLASAAATTVLVVAAVASPASARPATTGTPAPVAPTFVDGLAQAVFSTNPTDWYSGEVWVQAPFDSDHDGELDRIHTDFSAPREVLTEGQPVLRGYGGRVQQLGRRSPARLAAAAPAAGAVLDGLRHQPGDQHQPRVDLGAARIRRRPCGVTRHRPLRRLPDVGRQQRDPGR